MGQTERKGCIPFCGPKCITYNYLFRILKRHFSFSLLFLKIVSTASTDSNYHVRMSTTVKVWKLGKISYRSGLRLQEFLAKKHLNENGNANTILLLEHTPVYTIGIRSQSYTQTEEERLKKLGADFHRTNRGGLITFHGPGQLIAYPILNLKDFKLSMKCYVANLEVSVMKLCESLNLNAYTCEHTGVWINDKKVCAIGVHGSRYIATHGLALNCSLDILKWFEYIVPCGLEGKGVTSLSKELGLDYSVDEAAKLFIENFCFTFNCNHIQFPNEEAECIINSFKDSNQEIINDIETSRRNEISP